MSFISAALIRLPQLPVVWKCKPVLMVTQWMSAVRGSSHDRICVTERSYIYTKPVYFWQWRCPVAHKASSNQYDVPRDVHGYMAGYLEEEHQQILIPPGSDDHACWDSPERVLNGLRDWLSHFHCSIKTSQLKLWLFHVLFLLQDWPLCMMRYAKMILFHRNQKCFLLWIWFSW